VWIERPDLDITSAGYRLIYRDEINMDLSLGVGTVCSDYSGLP